MEPLAVDLNVLRAILSTEAGDLKLDLGRVLMARVAAVGANGRGTLSLAGELLDAEFPEGVSAGQELRLAVRELTPDKVVLSIQSEQSQQAQAPVPLLGPIVPMPLGGSLQVQERGGSRSALLPDGSRALTLRYDAPSFGAIDMQFVLDPQSSLRLALTVPAGDSHEAAQDAAPRLENALTEATGRLVSLSIRPRRQPLEVFA